jgi:hypothetical protein
VPVAGLHHSAAAAAEVLSTSLTPGRSTARRRHRAARGDPQPLALAAGLPGARTHPADEAAGRCSARAGARDYVEPAVHETVSWLAARRVARLSRLQLRQRHDCCSISLPA